MHSPIPALPFNRCLALVGVLAVLALTGVVAGRCFAQQKDGSIKGMIEALKDPNSSVRLTAAASLGRLGAAGAEGVPALTEALKDKDVDVRGTAVMALGRIGSKAKTATASLAELLADPNRDIRCAAALSLARIGKEASSALSSLLAMAKKDDKVDQVYAVFALAVLDARPGPRISTLTDFLSDVSPLVRGSAAYLLGELGPDARQTIPALTGLLIDNDKDVRTAAILALAEMGSGAREAVPTLVQLLQDKDFSVRAAARQVLSEMGLGAGRTGMFFLARSLVQKDFNQILTEYEADADKTGEAKIPRQMLADIKSVFENASSVEVLRLQTPFPGKTAPSGKPASFHGLEIAERAVLDKLDRRHELSAFLQKSLHWDSYRQLPFFNPRHGLRVVQGKRTLDLVISLDSNRINVFEGNEPKGTITILAAKSPILDDFLRELAKKAPDVKKESEKKKKEPDVKKESEKKKEPDLKKEPQKKKDLIRTADLLVVARDQHIQVLSELDEKIGGRLAKIPGVQVIDYGLTDIVSIAKGKDGKEDITVFIQGYRPESFMFDRFRMVTGRKFTADERGIALLGARQAGVLNKKVGDNITVEGETLKIIGIYEGVSFLENGFVLVPPRELQRMKKREGRVTGFAIVLERKDQAMSVKQSIEALADENGRSLRLAAELVVKEEPNKK